MGWNNPPVRWRQLERALDGRPWEELDGDGGDSPAWTRVRERYHAPESLRREQALRAEDGAAAIEPYAELHCHSNFSFLDGASHPEELAEEAARMGLQAMAITDHDGMYGVVRFAQAAAELGLATVFGAELSLQLSQPQNGVADPEGSHLLVLARGAEGYTRLCQAITAGQLDGGQKGRPSYRLQDLAARAEGHWHVLTGCRKGAVRRAWESSGSAAAEEELRRLVELFGRQRVSVELSMADVAEDTERNDALVRLAERCGVSTVATGEVHYATPQRARLGAAMAAVRARRGLDEIQGWLPGGSRHLRSPAEMTRRFSRYPGAVRRAAELAQECAFNLRLMAPRLPPFPVPEGHTEHTWLCHLTWQGAVRRYGTAEQAPRAYAQLRHELDVIGRMGFPGYFLVVYDIVRFCSEQKILCQGRGSAANSAVCYALGITNVDAVRYELLFERFLAEGRDGPPDIDIDIESGRREEAIQYVYTAHGRQNSALVANVISYRPRSAVRDMAKALGFSQGQQDAWSKQMESWSSVSAPEDAEIPQQVLALAEQLRGFPRHLGIHPGGMVICDRPVSSVCPVEWASMPERSVLQWDKDDCAEAGLVKFDLLGLGMLAALHHMVDLIAAQHGVDVDLGALDLEDPAVYEMLQRADSVGVFQVESRAQMTTLPRLKPRTFYDLVVEVALIRPGPIQGGSVHPYIRRRNGDEAPHYEHPLLKPALERTYGVPLFQEQMMKIAVDVAGFTAAESDQLRRAMGAKRSGERMERLRERFYAGMAQRGIEGETAERVFGKLKAFANFGFPESHALSFAHLVFASSWCKLYYPAAFCAGLLRAQPMGFYSPQSLVADARRHGVVVRGPEINSSGESAGLEGCEDSRGGAAVRLGLASVRELGETAAQRIVAEREERGQYCSMSELARRARLNTAQLEALATAGACRSVQQHRRQALWQAGAAALETAEQLPGVTIAGTTPALPGMSDVERAAADVWATGVSPDSFPTQFLRSRLVELGAHSAADLGAAPDGTRLRSAGAVTHRQRPATAGGVTFLNLEDETGMVNVICSPGFWKRNRTVLMTSSALLIGGRLQNHDGVVNLVAERAEPLPLATASQARDFR